MAHTANAIEGEIYIGIYDDNATSRAYPDGGIRKYLYGIKLSEDIWRLKPYVELQTISDKYNGDGSFHPASIEYNAGLEFNIYDGLYFEYKHMCWHPVDREGTVEQYNLYLLKYRFGE